MAQRSSDEEEERHPVKKNKNEVQELLLAHGAPIARAWFGLPLAEQRHYTLRRAGELHGHPWRLVNGNILGSGGQLEAGRRRHEGPPNQQSAQQQHRTSHGILRQAASSLL